MKPLHRRNLLLLSLFITGSFLFGIFFSSLPIIAPIPPTPPFFFKSMRFAR